MFSHFFIPLNEASRGYTSFYDSRGCILEQRSTLRVGLLTDTETLAHAAVPLNKK